MSASESSDSAKGILRAVLALATLATPLFAASYVIPPDVDLIRDADVIAIVTIRSSHSYYAEDGTIATDHAAVVDRVLKSQLGEGIEITITQRGGVVGDVGFAVSSEPPFHAGERTLLLLQQLGDGRFTTLSGELGKFRFVTDSESHTLLERGASDGGIFGWDASGRSHVDRPRDAAGFVQYISAVVAGQTPAVDYFAPEGVHAREAQTHAHASPYDYLLSGNPRWEQGGFGMKNINTQAAEPDTIGILTAAMSAWNRAPNAQIHITYDGADAGGRFGRNDLKTLVLFDGDLPTGYVGVASHWYEREHMFRGASYGTMIECDIVIETGLSGSYMQSVLTHELGHCLGFRHAETSDALMYGIVKRNPAFGQWDLDAASHVYGSGISCAIPVIATQSEAKVIRPATTVTLALTAAGAEPLTYQWYEGPAGIVTKPVGSDSPTFTTIPLTASTQFWVRVSNVCGSTDSAAIAVTIIGSRRRAVGHGD